MTMSVIESWRRLALALMVVTALAIGLTVARGALPGADAQEPTEAVFVISGIPVEASNGFADLGPGTGTDSGVLGISCTGASPRSGSNLVPGQVITELLADRTYLRIIRTTGQTITGPVGINCTIDLIVASEADDTMQQLESAAEAAR
jgi:hypothetical protein